MEKTIVSVGDKVIFSPKFLANNGEVFEIELPDSYWIICDENEDMLFCFNRGDFKIV